MEYRRAKMIELHNADVVIREKDFDIYWGDYVELGGRFEIENIDQKSLFESLNLISDGNDNLCFRHYKNVFGDGGNSEDSSAILKLEVKIENHSMLLIKTTRNALSNPKLLKTRPDLPTIFTQEVTYHGNYTIWWPETDSALQAAE